MTGRYSITIYVALATVSLSSLALGDTGDTGGVSSIIDIFLGGNLIDVQASKGGNKNIKPTCSITKGGTLLSFHGARAEVEVPCRYNVAEFFCHSKIRIIAENGMARDKRTFVSSVSVRKSRDPSDSVGGVVDDYDEVALTMDDLKLFFEAPDNLTQADSPWIKVSDELYVTLVNDKMWTLRVDLPAKEVILLDPNNAVEVYLSYVDQINDMSKAGGLTVVCADSTFGPVEKSTGYLCGNADSSGNNNDKHHLKDSADRVGLKVTDYLTYNILVEQDVQQSTCAYPIEAVWRCAQFLHRSTYVYKCFERRNISPLQAYASCVRLRCRKDWPSCKALADVLGDCPRYKKFKNQLPCERVLQESEE
ncbi:uncharacterized protein LOC143276440 [Babylonia areolata]|uniref:uncharacterized protein LOC143276440 n=1 Tax=Babylonia areolata TaxID=304850 RepID=UPI003FD20538